MLIALLMAAVLMMSGCSSLVLRDSAVDNQQSVVIINGEHITKQQFMSLYSYNLYVEQYSAQMMAQLGLSDGSVDTQSIINNTLQTFLANSLIGQKAAELGLDQFTDEENADLDAEAQAEYEQEQTNGGTDSLESIRNSLRLNRISDRLRDYASASVVVDDAALQEALDQKIADQKSSYESNGNAFNSAYNGTSTTVYYTPAGYRLIHVYRMNKPTPDDGTEADLTAFNEQAADMLARLQEGAPLDGLEIVETDYRITDTSSLPNADVDAAAMALTEKGSLTGMIENSTAVFVARYVEDVEEHTLTLDDVREALYEEVLKNAKDEAYSAAMSDWLNESDVQLYLDRLN